MAKWNIPWPVFIFLFFRALDQRCQNIPKDRKIAPEERVLCFLASHARLSSVFWKNRVIIAKNTNKLSSQASRVEQATTYVNHCNNYFLLEYAVPPDSKRLIPFCATAEVQCSSTRYMLAWAAHIVHPVVYREEIAIIRVIGIGFVAKGLMLIPADPWNNQGWIWPKL